MIAALVDQGVSWMRSLVLRWLSLRAPKDRIHGLVVVDLINEEDAKERFSKVGEALQLIERLDPARMRMIQRELAQIVLFESGPEYWPASRTCVLYDIRDLSAVDIALHVIHETAHARLWRRGFRYSPEVRDRIERACVASEVRFLNRMPNGGRLRDEAWSKLDKQWWTADHVRNRRARDLEDLGAPQWIVRLWERIAR